jgi:hypothetical protein
LQAITEWKDVICRLYSKALLGTTRPLTHNTSGAAYLSAEQDSARSLMLI